MKSHLKTISVLASVLTIEAPPVLIWAQSPGPAPVPTALPMKAPTVQNPTVNAPKPPAVTAPTGGSTTAPTVAPSAGNTNGASPSPSAAKTRAPLITTAYSDSAYHTAITSGSPVILIFSDSTDMVWTKQAPLLQGILREAEFRKYPSFQIDMTDRAVSEKFSVPQATTILIMKDGDERIRSARMINPDVIRKMFRLANAL